MDSFGRICIFYKFFNINSTKKLQRFQGFSDFCSILWSQQSSVYKPNLLFYAIFSTLQFCSAWRLKKTTRCCQGNAWIGAASEVSPGWKQCVCASACPSHLKCMRTRVCVCLDCFERIVNPFSAGTLAIANGTSAQMYALLNETKQNKKMHFHTNLHHSNIPTHSLFIPFIIRGG